MKHLKNHKTLLGPDLMKLQPKLRMVANASPEVSAVRAEHLGALMVEAPKLLETLPLARKPDDVPRPKRALGAKAHPQTLHALATNVQVGVFVHTDGSAASAVPGAHAQSGRLVAASLPISELPQLAALPGVRHVELAEALTSPTPLVQGTTAHAPKPAPHAHPHLHHRGRAVIIGIIDVQGFDFSHEDFLVLNAKEVHTRFTRIWDQGGKVRPPPPGGRFNYGSELTETMLNKALAAARRVHVPAYELEPQSEMHESSHGTHVASIAAGNHGVCAGAEIAAVLVSLPAEDLDRRHSFYDSRRLVDAVDYLLAYADERKKPISINISLGTNGHAHDGSSAVCRWVDSALVVPGRSICVAAGNAGQEVATYEGDLGYVTGRIHTSGRVAAAGLAHDIEWVVVGNGKADISENELEIWYGAQDRFAVSIRPPDASEWIGPIEPRQFIENRQLPDGSFLSIYNELYHPANGLNYLAVYLSPLLDPSGVVGVTSGAWTVRLHGREVRDGRFDGWIERDDPQPQRRVGPKEAWKFPSFFAERSNVDNASVSSLACAQRIVSVANLDAGSGRIHITSSQGPTRDGRFKPDVAAPGTQVVAANGFADARTPWVAMTGTSMASPQVAGVIGLMLAIEPELTAAQINGILQRTAQPLPGADYRWINDAGFGALDAARCLDEAAQVRLREDLT